MSEYEIDDLPVRVGLALNGDGFKFLAKNAALSELARLPSGEPRPFSTIMYVGCNTCKPEEIITNSHTDRIRKFPFGSGSETLDRCID